METCDVQPKKDFGHYDRCPNPACRWKLPDKAKICYNCGARVCSSC